MADTGMRIAHSITIDARDGSISIEGTRLPYHLQRDSVRISEIDGMISTVGVAFYADEVVLISKNGERRTQKTMALEHELEWARREGRRVVLEGMADVVEALYDGAMEKLKSHPARYVLGLDDEQRKALLSGTTHSPSGQSTNGEGDTA